MNDSHSRQITPSRAEPQPLPENIRSVQPGGGVCYRIELAWGRLRRWRLTHFWPGYVKEMAALRKGDCQGAPHAIIDPRDLKYCRNVCGCFWADADDKFRWRRSIPLAPWGAAELLLMGGPLFVMTILAAVTLRWYVALPPAAILGLIIYFFRSPPRRVPPEPETWVSPADGKIAEITELPHDDFVDGPAVRIGIFLSIFNVHLNRSPVAARVIALRYSPGEFLNAMRPESALRNENMWIALEEDSPPHRRLVVRQISGAIARRIVCELRPGERVARGQVFGMIKLGSRTELILPKEDGLEVKVEVGQKVKAGTTVVAEYGGENKK
jgi:phosphatidylserine decarboxylase